MIYLDLGDLLRIVERVIGDSGVVRDHGLLESALARPKAGVHGREAYPDIHQKAAALLHSLVRNHALIDGNKRLALAATLVFYGINGQRLALSNDAAYDLVMMVASGELDAVGDIAAELERGSKAWR